VSGNSATNRGGGIYADKSSVSIINSTVSDNFSGSYGGGFYVADSSLSLINSTISGNSAANAGGLYSKSGSISLINSIVAGNLAASGAEIGDFGGATTFSNNNSLLGDSSHNNAQAFVNFTPNATYDITATNNGTQATTLSSILTPLADNGGATQTHALVAGSPAIDAGDNAICATAPINNLDQRGEKRTEGSACDIGSYEVNSSFYVVPLPNGKAVIFSL